MSFLTSFITFIFSFPLIIIALNNIDDDFNIDISLNNENFLNDDSDSLLYLHIIDMSSKPCHILQLNNPKTIDSSTWRFSVTIYSSTISSVSSSSASYYYYITRWDEYQFYLCESGEYCIYEQDSIEMVTLISNVSPSGKFYAHLITTTLPPLLNQENNNNNNNDYNDNDDNNSDNDNNNNNNNNILIPKTNLLINNSSSSSSSSNGSKNDDLPTDMIIIEISAIIILIGVCGIVYACYKHWLHYQRNKKEIQYLMHPHTHTELLVHSEHSISMNSKKSAVL